MEMQAGISQTVSIPARRWHRRTPAQLLKAGAPLAPSDPSDKSPDSFELHVAGLDPGAPPLVLKPVEWTTETKTAETGDETVTKEVMTTPMASTVRRIDTIFGQCNEPVPPKPEDVPAAEAIQVAAREKLPQIRVCLKGFCNKVEVMSTDISLRYTTTAPNALGAAGTIATEVRKMVKEYNAALQGLVAKLALAYTGMTGKGPLMRLLQRLMSSAPDSAQGLLNRAGVFGSKLLLTATRTHGEGSLERELLAVLYNSGESPWNIVSGQGGFSELVYTNAVEEHIRRQGVDMLNNTLLWRLHKVNASVVVMGKAIRRYAAALPDGQVLTDDLWLLARALDYRNPEGKAREKAAKRMRKAAKRMRKAARKMAKTVTKGKRKR